MYNLILGTPVIFIILSSWTSFIFFNLWRTNQLFFCIGSFYTFFNFLVSLASLKTFCLCRISCLILSLPHKILSWGIHNLFFNAYSTRLPTALPKSKLWPNGIPVWTSFRITSSSQWTSQGIIWADSLAVTLFNLAGMQPSMQSANTSVYIFTEVQTFKDFLSTLRAT